MIRFLLDRPVAVIMAFIACFIIGTVTYFALPVSLLPDIAIPEVTVHVSGANLSARELENTVVKPFRQSLAQVNRLRDIRSETRDGDGLIRLNFNYGTNTDLAFIEVNEKVDAAMSVLPAGTERPRVIKASATDIPVFYLNLTLKHAAGGEAGGSAFHELSQFAESVIKRQVEQLPEIAMVDITGLAYRQLLIEPDMQKMDGARIGLEDIEEALTANNIEPGSMTVRDGYYEYNVHADVALRSAEDVRNIYIRKAGRLFRLKDLAEVRETGQKAKGMSLAGGQQAVTMAIIKQPDESMEDMKLALDQTIARLKASYPNIDFYISRNQTDLLDYTIGNLKENLGLGFILVFLVAILFLGDVRSPFIIGLSMLVSLVVCMLFFYVFRVSLNIVSLSGLILALGMMIDNAIIVTENIAQFREKGYTLKEACVAGTNEVITPMLSASLTSIAVFVPLVFLSGIGGAMFYDQAFAVTAGQLVSYLTGILLMPVLYFVTYSIPKTKPWKRSLSINNPLKGYTLDKAYERGVNIAFKYPGTCVFTLVISLPLCVALFSLIRKERMPQIGQTELSLRIDWNENIHIDENRRRTSLLLRHGLTVPAEHTAYIGQQQYLLNKEHEYSGSECGIWFKVSDPRLTGILESGARSWLKRWYPGAVLTFSPPESVYEKLFLTGEADLVAELYPGNKEPGADPADIRAVERHLQRIYRQLNNTPFENQLNIRIDHARLMLYNVSYDEVYRVLKTSFRENNVQVLRSYQHYLPVVLAGKDQTAEEVVRHTLVRSEPDQAGVIHYVPLSALVSMQPSEDLKTITAGKNGEYIPFIYQRVSDGRKLMDSIRTIVKGYGDWDLGFSGAIFSNRTMLNELIVILLISVLLMYFILAAQFESFLQPLIILIELPVDIAAALLFLQACGHTLNLMSITGIIVTCGVIINDSILKIDMINELRNSGMPLMQAIHEGGRRRLRPIVMTALTSVFAMVPLLFSFDMGSELQKPLSIAMIAAMLVGTMVSLFFIPVVYWLIYRKQVIK